MKTLRAHNLFRTNKEKKEGSLGGFTLLEILIALAVFAILATITSSAMFHAFDTRSRVNEQADKLMELQIAMSLIEKDIQQAVSRSVFGNNMQIFPSFVGQKDYLELTRGGLTNPNSHEKRSTLQRIALFCSAHQLIRRRWAMLDNSDRNLYKDKVLLNNVTTCQFAYLNDSLQVLQEWRADNLPQVKSQTSLPKAVKLSLTLSEWGKGSFLFVIPQGLYALS